MLRERHALQFDPGVGVEFAVTRLCPDDEFGRQSAAAEPPVHDQCLSKAGVGVQPALPRDGGKPGQLLGPRNVRCGSGTRR